MRVLPFLLGVVLFLSQLSFKAHVFPKMFKVCWPYVVSLLDWTPMFEWYTARFVVKNREFSIYMLEVPFAYWSCVSRLCKEKLQS